LPGFVWASGFSQWIADVTESDCCLRREIAAKDCTQLLVAQFWATVSRKMRIQFRENTYKLLEHKYLFQERGIIEVKGKGKMKTYLLIGKKQGRSSVSSHQSPG
jgi:hypothetical protein